MQDAPGGQYLLAGRNCGKDRPEKGKSLSENPCGALVAKLKVFDMPSAVKTGIIT